MPKKGIINNPKGRTPGSPNKITTEIRDLIRTFLEQNISRMQEDFDKLEPYQRLMFFERLFKYVVPVMSSTDMKIDFNTLSESQLNGVIQELLIKSE